MFLYNSSICTVAAPLLNTLHCGACLDTMEKHVVRRWLWLRVTKNGATHGQRTDCMIVTNHVSLQCVASKLQARSGDTLQCNIHERLLR